MPRKARNAKIDTKNARRMLPVRREPYFQALQKGLAVGYRKLPGGKAGTWIVRIYDADTRKREYQALGNADDLVDADGSLTLTFDQAQAQARAWAASTRHMGGAAGTTYTVRDAMRDYESNYYASGGKDQAGLRRTVAVHILPQLGNRRLDRLTLPVLRTWLHNLAAAPARLRTAKGATAHNFRRVDSADADAVRGRQATANRILTTLKAALNLAFADGRVASDDAWRRLKPFPNTDAPRVRYLLDDEVVRFINATSGAFRRLAQAALFTGCRYSELGRLRRSDFDRHASLLHIRTSKGRGTVSRVVPLSNEAVRFFEALAAGKPGSSLLLVRDDGECWKASNQDRPIKQASRAVGIDPAISFHDLRHTFASRLARRGVSMSVIAKAIGDSEAITAKYYAHLSPTYVSDTIRAHAGGLGIEDDEVGNIEILSPRPARSG